MGKNMNQNMQLIENEIKRLQRLLHQDVKTLTDEELLDLHFIRNSGTVSLRYYSPLGRPIDFGIGATAREKCNPHVNETTVSEFYISTVWIGHDMSMRKYFLKEGEKITPIIFETMIFKESQSGENMSGLDLYQERYSTIEEAEAGHELAVQLTKEWVKNGKVYTPN